MDVGQAMQVVYSKAATPIFEFKAQTIESKSEFPGIVKYFAASDGHKPPPGSVW
jgi:hypothetical protein